jgi:hypothetical protein
MISCYSLSFYTTRYGSTNYFICILAGSPPTLWWVLIVASTVHCTTVKLIFNWSRNRVTTLTLSCFRRQPLSTKLAWKVIIQLLQKNQHHLKQHTQRHSVLYFFNEPIAIKMKPSCKSCTIECFYMNIVYIHVFIVDK